MKFSILKSHGLNGTGVDYLQFDIQTDKGYLKTLHACKWPTYNCQVFNIYPMSNLLDLCTTKDDAMEVVKWVKEQMKCKSPLLLFDVQSAYFDKLSLLFEVYHQSPYVSTNGSRMVMGFVKV